MFYSQDCSCMHDIWYAVDADSYHNWKDMLLKYYCLLIFGGIFSIPSALGKSNKECLLKGVCLGQEIKQLTNVGLSECSMACSEYFGTDQECWGTTYFRDSQTCSVYSDCPEIDDGVNEAVTNRNTCFMYSDCKWKRVFKTSLPNNSRVWSGG